MDKVSTQNIKNVILVSHSGAGKTSLADSLAHLAGLNSRLGSVNSGTSLSDFHPDEKERKISIYSSVLVFNWNDKKINLLDAPGYADFVGETLASLEAADAAGVLINATAGIEVGTEFIWEYLDKKNLPRFIFINRLDKENSDFFSTYEAIRQRFGKKCVAFTYPIGKEASFSSVINLITEEGMDKAGNEDKEKIAKFKENLIESAAEANDTLLEKYLNGEELSKEELVSSLKKAVLEGKIFPVLCGSATKEVGSKEALDVISDFLPSPADRPPKEAKKADSDEKIEIKCDENEPFAAQVFKTISDPYVGQLTVFKIFSGKISSDSHFFNSSTQTKERFGQLLCLVGREQKPVSEAVAGDIISVAKLKNTHTGDSLCDEKQKVVFDEISLPIPVISFSVKPKSRGDEEKISQALAKLSGEDPTVKIGRDVQTKELIISGMGDLHVAVVINNLKTRFGVDVELGTPKVAYKETIKKKVQVQGKYKKQSGGRGQYGDVWLELEPLPKDVDFEFVNKIVGGAVPRQYIPSVEKGVKNAMAEGVLAGFPLVNLKVTIYDGSYHEVDSSDMAFQIAGAMALRKGALEANPVLLEPIMEIEVVVPEEFMGQISGDLNGRRGRILGMDMKGDLQVVKAHVPLAEMFKYANELRSMTGGRGFYTMKFSHYEEVPQKIAQEIVARSQKKAEEE
jgi:elongation factor G